MRRKGWGWRLKTNRLEVRRQLQILIAVAVASNILIFAVAFHGIHKLGEIHTETAKWASRKAAVHMMSSLGSRLYQVIAATAISRDIKANSIPWQEVKEQAAEELSNITSSDISNTEEKRAAVDIASTAFTEMVNIYEQKLCALIVSDKLHDKEISLLMATVNEQVEVIQQRMYELVELADLDSKNAEEEFGVTQGATLFQVVGIALLSMAVLIASFVVITKRLRRQLGAEPRLVIGVAEKISRGDLSEKISTVPGDQESLLAAIKSMQEGLKGIVCDTRNVASIIGTAATELSADAGRVRDVTDCQDQHVADMSNAVDGLTESIKQINATTTAAQDLVASSRQRAEEGGVIVHDAAEEIHVIAKSVLASSKIIQELGTRSESISTITGAIKDIAKQTNLLALNAAIEAARAGEQGRGFAVVADEVRKLAEATTTFTHEITSVVGEIQERIRQAMDSMEECNIRVGRGSELAERLGTAMDETIKGFDFVVATFNQTARSLSEQSSAGQEMAQTVSAVAEAVKSNGGHVRKIAGATTQLNEMATQLLTATSRFHV